MTAAAPRPAAQRPTTPLGWRLAAVVVVALTFALRVYRLDHQSLWFDEGFSAAMALGPFGEIFAHAADDPHPPGFHVLLWLWKYPAGGSEFALRMFSLVAGVGSVALIFRLGVRLGGPSLGLAAALLAAVNPFLVHYSQELRVYSWLLALSLVSAVLLLRALDGRLQWRWYALAAGVFVNMHYFACFVLATHAVWVLLTDRRRSTLLAWAAHAVAGCLMFAPWLLYAAPAMAAYRTAAATPLNPGEAIRKVVVAFSNGVVPPDAVPGLVTQVGLVAVAGGAVALVVQRRWQLLVMIALGIAAPVVGLYLVSFVKPTFNPRYVISALPYVLLLAAGMPVLLARRHVALGMGAALLLALPFAKPLQGYYTDPALARDDWRTLTAYVQERSTPDDVYVFNAWYDQYVFDYYAGGPQRRVGVPRNAALTAESAAALLNGAMPAPGGRQWLLLWQDEVSDPGNYLPGTADDQAEPVAQLWQGPVRAFGYQPRAGQAFRPLAPANPLAADLGPVALEGYSVDRTSAAAGDTLKVVLYWRAKQTMAEDYRGFVHLLGRDMLVYGQQDKVTIGFYHPTTSWRPGELLRDEYTFPVDPASPAGEYTLEVGMYHYPSFERLPALAPDGRPTADSVILPTRITLRPR